MVGNGLSFYMSLSDLPRMAMPKQKSRAASRGNELTRSMEPDNFSLFVRAPCEAVRSHCAKSGLLHPPFLLFLENNLFLRLLLFKRVRISYETIIWISIPYPTKADYFNNILSR